MKRNTAAWLILGGIIAFALISFVVNPDKSADASASAPEDLSQLELVTSKSFCLSDPASAHVNVYVTVRNIGSTEGTMEIRPWRRYSDSSVNDSILDAFKVTVPANSTKKTYGEYGYNAEAHSLLECGVFVDDATEPTPLEAL
jgi:hypothetical protein